MRTKTIKLYNFEELDDEIKEKVIENFEIERLTDYDWYMYILEDFKEEINKKGIDFYLKEIEFDIYKNYIKLDFDIFDNLKFLKSVLSKEKLNKIIILNDLEKDKNKKFDLENINIINKNEETIFYYDFGEENFCFEDKINEEELNNYFNDLRKELLKRLYKEYEYLISEENIKNFLINNEYEFTKNGEEY